MRIALVVPPFLAVPPLNYGGTELFVAHLAEGLKARGHHPVVYTVGESQVRCETRWREPHGHWPLTEPMEGSLEDLEHASWACQDAAADCDLIHINNAPGLSFSRFVPQPFLYTLHHEHTPMLSRFYAQFPGVHYVAISRRQAGFETQLPRLSIIHHGVALQQYRVAAGSNRNYLAFIGRITPAKGVHLAIDVARRAGLPLKIAGEVQPPFRDYWRRAIRPRVDGKQVEFIGEIGLEGKNELLAGALALLFPIQWEEPFGLVMIEAMACGVPVLALSRGSVPEVIDAGVTGWACRSVGEMVKRARELPLNAARCRARAAQRFSMERMVGDYVALYEARLRQEPARPAGATGRAEEAWRDEAEPGERPQGTLPEVA